MSYTNWHSNTVHFKTIDLRGIAGNFFPGLKKQAMALPVGEGLEIIQSFDPLPLYEVMDMLGFEHHTEQKAQHEFHVWFYRTQMKEDTGAIPMRCNTFSNGRIRPPYGNVATTDSEHRGLRQFSEYRLGNQKECYDPKQHHIDQ